MTDTNKEIDADHLVEVEEDSSKQFGAGEGEDVKEPVGTREDINSSDKDELLSNIEVEATDGNIPYEMFGDADKKVVERTSSVGNRPVLLVPNPEEKTDFKPSILDSGNKVDLPSGDETAGPQESIFIRVIRKVTVEPAVFLVMLAISFALITNGNLMIDRICRLKFNVSADICSNYTYYTDVKDEVQNVATNYNMYGSLIQSVPPVFFAFFLGGWSDRHGRKVLLLLPMIGYFISNTITLIFCFYDDLEAEYFFIPSVFTGITGGMVSFVMGAFSYISDITNQKERTKRIAIVDLALFLALPVGLVASGQIIAVGGFLPVYAANMGIILLAVLYLLLFLKETIHPSPEDRKNAWKDLIDVKNVTNNFKTIFKLRPNHDRAYILLLFFSTLCFMVPLMGEGSIMLLFVQNKFNWTQQQLSTYQAFVILVTAIGMVIIFRFLLKKWRLSDPVLGLISAFGTVVRSILFSISVGGWMLYLSSLLTFFQPIGMPSMRSFMSKLVGNDEQGKLYAVIASGEAIVPVFASIMYTQVYQITKNNFAGAAFFVSAVLMLFPFVTFSWIYWDRRRQAAAAVNQMRDNISTAEEC